MAASIVRVALTSALLAAALAAPACVESTASPPTVATADGGCIVGCDGSTGNDAVAPVDGDTPDQSNPVDAADAGADAPTEAAADAALEAEAEAGPPPIDHVVDAVNGSDTNAGTVAAPFKTLTKAMTTGAPTNVYLADGVFDSSTQGSGTIAVPDGVTLHAIHPDAATLSGVTLSMSGSGGIDGVRLDGLTRIQAASVTGSPTLALVGVRIRSTNSNLTADATLELGGKVHATMSPGTLAGGLYSFATGALGTVAALQGSAQLLVQGGIFDGNDVETPLNPVIGVKDTASVVLDGVTLRNLSIYSASTCGVLYVQGAAPLARGTITLQGGSVLDKVSSAGFPTYVCGGIFAGASSTVTVDASTISRVGTTSSASAIFGNASDMVFNVLNGSVLSGNGRGIALTVSGGTNLVKIDNASITGSTNPGSGHAILLSGAIALDINQLAFTGNVRGATIANPQSVKVRNSVFTGNGGYGLEITSSSVPAIVVDLGTAGSVGGNTFATNTTGNLNTATGGTVNAVGNTWEASQQSADAAGHYATPSQKLGVQAGRNYTTNAASTLNL